MFQKLVSRNDDLRRLVDRGYAVGFDQGYLIVRDIPYLDEHKQLKIGAFVAKLVFKTAEEVEQDDHQLYFAGSIPHDIEGRPIPNLAGGPTSIPLSEANNDVVVQRSFSNKPPSGRFEDHFHKVESYVGIISGPAMELHDASPYTFRTVEAVPDSVFNFHDTLTSRAAIGDLSAKFANDVVAIIGLGGTGAYVLEFLVKTHVREIRAFDHDRFYVHNAFRSPGTLLKDELNKPKAEVYQNRYQSFRKGLTVERRAIDSTSADALNGVTFAFVCVDKGSARAPIVDLLLALKIPFIDVGMGLNRKQGALNGMLRTTYFSAEDGAQIRTKGLVELTDAPDEEYRTNIQTGELNALNASLAVIKFKKIRGFYFDEEPWFHALFGLGDCRVFGESELA